MSGCSVFLGFCHFKVTITHKITEWFNLGGNVASKIQRKVFRNLVQEKNWREKKRYQHEIHCFC